MESKFYSLQECMLQAESTIYSVLALWLLEMLGFWFFMMGNYHG
ncbi:hypothetical protein [Desulfocicer niacini]